MNLKLPEDLAVSDQPESSDNQWESGDNLYISDKETGYFARQLILDDFGENKQKALLKTHITFIGIGGINCPALIYLLAVGIRNITLIEHDKVDITNLNRQIIYSYNDIGKDKILCATNFIKKNYPEVKILSYNKKINKKNCFKLIKKTNLVIDGTDNWSTMLAINDHCVKNYIPLLSASVTGFDGNIVLFENFKGKHICLRCVFPYQKDLNLPRCETSGILGTSAGIIGLLSAQKVVNFLTSNNKKSTQSTITYFDGKNVSINDIKIDCNKKCKLI